MHWIILNHNVAYLFEPFDSLDQFAERISKYDVFAFAIFPSVLPLLDLALLFSLFSLL